MRTVLQVIVITALSACSATPTPSSIHHVVFLKLKDPGEIAALERSCNELLVPIPGVIEYASGRPVDTGRAAVERDYDIAILVVFPTAAEYQAYLVHPNHDALVKEWKPRFASMRIYDFSP
ncbi:MAG: Dabb family protein [Phycisphaerales bacterium]|nr:Dabb family protein [Phycisphaerales bacterium]